MKWFTVDKEYLSYLRNYESRILIADYGDDKLKPFFGALFEIGDLVYITQVSHPKQRHFRIKEDSDFVKLYNRTRLIAVVNLNYMFPVHKNRLIEIKYKNIDEFRTFDNDNQKSYYITLLKREMKEIKKRNLDQKAINLYNQKYNYPLDRVSIRCVDFKKLEQKCKEYETGNNIEQKALEEDVITKE